LLDQVCAFLNACLIPFFEGTAPFEVVLERVGLPILIVNATTALLLNIAVVFLIGSASSLVLTLSGVIKDILLVGGSVVLLGSTVTFTQMAGYSIALFGLFALYVISLFPVSILLTRHSFSMRSVKPNKFVPRLCFSHSFYSLFLPLALLM
jgi:hypothetical protein